MAETSKNVLSLDSQEAIAFFMKSEQYHGFELPEYFVFDDLLQFVKDKVGDTPYEACLKESASPEELHDVNLNITLNKDGRYAVRPAILANPFLYYFLVRELCDEKGWPIVKDLFEKFNVPHITSCALPVIAREIEKFHKSTAILNWWNSMEQRSIELSLEYRYMFVTDITNCYGSVNPQVIDWAFSLKDTQYERPCEVPIAKNVRTLIRTFQQGRNIGIPQGSAIFDFVAEIILGYCDLLLHEALQAKAREWEEQGRHFPAYEIIRYRDDYRIFCNDKGVLEDISYVLQHTLGKLNFQMNSMKTKISGSIVTDAIKPDKLAYIYNTPVFNKRGTDFDSFEKHLLYILMFSRNHPNSGTVKTLLADFYERLSERLGIKTKKDESKAADIEDVTFDDDDKQPKKGSILDSLKTYAVTTSKFIPGGSVRAMVAVCAQIAQENAACSHYAFRVISTFVYSLQDAKEQCDIINKVYAKFCNQPNSEYNQIWLQKMTYQKDKAEGTSPYKVRLCKVAMGEDVDVWNCSWLKDTLTAKMSDVSIIDNEKLEDGTGLINFREQRAYDEFLLSD